MSELSDDPKLDQESKLEPFIVDGMYAKHLRFLMKLGGIDNPYDSEPEEYYDYDEGYMKSRFTWLPQHTDVLRKAIMEGDALLNFGKLLKPNDWNLYMRRAMNAVGILDDELVEIGWLRRRSD